VPLIRKCATLGGGQQDQARMEAGDFQQAIEDGALHWADVRELGQGDRGALRVR